MTIAETFLAEFDEEMRMTRRMLECVPDEGLDFQPHEKAMSLGRLAGHVAEMPDWGANTAEADELELAPPDAPGFQACTAKSKAEALAMFDRGVARAKAEIAKVSDEGMAVPWTLKMRGHALFTLPRITVLQKMVLKHIIHHRAQLSVYLRIRDVAIPGMYGPSADER